MLDSHVAILAHVADRMSRSASIAVKITRPGPLYPSVSTSALIALRSIAISVSISRSCARPISTVCSQTHIKGGSWTDIRCDSEWQWEQLRVMKVGGNESATKYFQSHGGTAALNNKDSKVKYTCNAAVKYKEELKKRAAADAREYVDLLIVSW